MVSSGMGLAVPPYTPLSETVPPRRTESIAAWRTVMPVYAGSLHGLLCQGIRQEPHRILGKGADGRIVRFHADGVDHRVGAPSVRHIAKLVTDVLCEIDRFHPVPLGHAAAFRNRFDGDDPLAEVSTDPAGELPHRAEPKDGQCAAGGDIGVFHSLPGGGKNIGEVEVPLIGQFVPDLYRSVVGVGHAQVFRLPAGDRPVELGEPEQARPAVVGMDLGGFALGLQPLFAHPAMAAGNVEGDDHPVARLEVPDLGADLLDDTHGFVAQDVAGLHVGAKDLVQVEVRAAYRR